ncbi:recombinase RecT [Campylobacter gastrosuis]|uniref:Recombinase RecT n=1 Tax=Campylobacter gastrosuis TaxID=2974576 RepID=A0ABT7HSU5_9BACT|nr:recombinase RecT [Campylobacter gastrosuis]MDL0089999.1 recombinase RecT [Campylobacter gastrosuis]
MQITQRENEARAIINAKMGQISTITAGDKAKASAFASAMINLANDANLAKCKVESVINTAMQIVQIGLHPNKLFGQAYVVPYGNTAQLQIGYKGLIALGMRNGWRFRAVAVYKCDTFNLEFNGLDDKIHFVPNYDERNDDDGAWVFNNLVGVIIYAKDSIDSVFSDFVSKKKLEKLRTASPNQKAGVLSGVWATWSEEMYKAKALKYVATRLPINDRLTEAVNMEDEPFRQNTQELQIKEQPKDLNQILKEQKSQKEPEILDYDATTGEVMTPNPYDLLQDELIRRGVSENSAENIVTRYNTEQVNAFLSDPSSIDSLAEN